MRRPTLFVEGCAGLAAVSLRLHGGRHARPPVSRMGNKAGYASAILRILGLRPGQGADRYLWCEPDPGCRLLLEAYRDADLARGAAEVLRSWADEEPRALWERLRAEGPPVLEPMTSHEVARWCLLAVSSMRGNPEAGYAIGDGCNTVWAGGSPQSSVAERFATTPTLPATIAPDLRAIDPREVARWVMIGVWCYRQGDQSSGGPVLPGDRRQDTSATATATARIALDIPAAIAPDLRDLSPIPGAVLYLDPPYADTTGYGADLSRAEVVEVARRWRAAGAVVAISEAVPLPSLLSDGWYAVEITGERIGQKRTFSRQQEEWLTLSHPPAWTPPRPVSLFGAISV